MTAVTARPGARGAATGRLVAAGVASVGCTYGMARYGFGLLLPDMSRCTLPAPRPAASPPS